MASIILFHCIQLDECFEKIFNPKIVRQSLIYNIQRNCSRARARARARVCAVRTLTSFELLGVEHKT